MEQMHIYGQRLPGEPMLVGMFQVSTAFFRLQPPHVADPKCVHVFTAVSAVSRPAGGCLKPGCAIAQAANVLHDAFEEPGRVLWRKVCGHGCALVCLAMQRAWTVCLIANRCGSIHSAASSILAQPTSGGVHSCRCDGMCRCC